MNPTDFLSTKNSRRIADYELDNETPHDRRWVAVQLALMRQIESNLSQCELEPQLSQTIAGIRAYARDVLGESI